MTLFNVKKNKSKKKCYITITGKTIVQYALFLIGKEYNILNNIFTKLNETEPSIDDGMYRVFCVTREGEEYKYDS